MTEMDVQSAEDYNSQVALYTQALEDVVHYIHKLKLVMAAYPLIVVLRVFKAFKAQPRLALLTQTLAAAGADLMHFLLVYSSLLLTLTIVGFSLFGRKILDFSSFMGSLNTVFRVMFGDFNWDGMQNVGQIEAFLWLSCTIIVMNLLMTIMVLVIVADGYTTLRKMNLYAETVPEEIMHMIVRWVGVKRGLVVPLEVVYTSLIELDRDYRRRNAHEAKSKVQSKLNDSEEVGVFLVGKDSKAFRESMERVSVHTGLESVTGNSPEKKPLRIAVLRCPNFCVGCR